MVHGRKKLSEAAAKRIVQQRMDKRTALAEYYLNRFAKSPVGVKLGKLYESNPTKARNTALSMAMQEQYLKSLKETTISTEFGTTPENVMRIVRVGAANRNRGNVFTEWPMTTTDDAIYFVDRVYKSTLRGATAGQVMSEQVNPNYGTEYDEENFGTGNGSATNFAASVSTTPVVPYTVQVILDGAIIAADDGAGGFTSTVLDTSTSTVDYTSGAISLDFLTAPATGESVDVQFQWNSEDSSNYTNYGDVSLTVTKKNFNARPHPLGYSFTEMVRLKLGSSGSGNVDDMLILAVGDEHARRTDYKAWQRGKRVAKTNAITTFDADFAAAGSDNDYNHAQTITSTIDNMSNDLYDDLKRGTLNVGYGGGKAISYLKKNKLWESDKSQSRVSGSFLAGYFDGMAIYQVPADANTVANNEIVLTYKNDDEAGDVGIAFGVLTELNAALDYPEFYRKGNIASVEDSMTINSKFCRLLQITNL